MIWHLSKPGAHHRARVLALLGIIWAILGVGIATEPPRRVGLIYEVLPIEARALIWLLPGLAAIVAAVWRRWDSWGWVALILPAAERGFAFAWGWATGTVHAAYLGFGIYAALMLLVYECAAGLDRVPGNHLPNDGGTGWQQKE